jgi:TPR repeat protein
MNSKKLNILLVFTILLIFSVVSRIFFNPIHDAWNAYEKKDYKTARELWLPLAEQGEPKAQFFLGFMQDMGFGVPENDKIAVKWYQLAAEQGDSRAQLFTGFMYDFGQGVLEDDQKAVKWYQLASEQGFKQAKINIYKLAKKNSPEALEILLNDAENGSAKAQESLAEMSKVRLEVSQNYEKSFNSGQVSEEREYDQVVKLMLNLLSRKDSEEAKNIILDRYRDMAQAQYKLKMMRVEGNGVLKDYNKELKWYKSLEYNERINKYNLAKNNAKQTLQDLKGAAEKGVVEAQFILATMYANGWGVSKDNKEAFRWFYQVAKEKGTASGTIEVDKFERKNIPQELKFLINDAESGIATSQLKLGMAYAHGQILLQNNEQAVKWYRLAAEQGNSDAQYALGMMYVKGLGVLASEQEAMKWFRCFGGQPTSICEGLTNGQKLNTIYIFVEFELSAESKILINDAKKGKVTAQHYLGDLYRDGIGVPHNSLLAYMWYSLSAFQGNESAINQINSLENKMSPQQIEQAQKMVRESKPTE